MTASSDAYKGIPSDVVLAEDLPETAICAETGQELPATEAYWFPFKARPGSLHLGNGYRPGSSSGKRHRSRDGEKQYRTRNATAAKNGEREIKARSRKQAGPTEEVVEVGDRTFTRIIPAPAAAPRDTLASLRARIAELEGAAA